MIRRRIKIRTLGQGSLRESSLHRFGGRACSLLSKLIRQSALQHQPAIFKSALLYQVLGIWLP